ncbi:DinB family protein [Chondrinema litorale]|uniref:DinB family protein n=1 Tax=Chondrinema litorale TaxID=2994555 RepID=UPI0025432CE8|nr:DinB family protein [Chondrinema litorale]UZR96371.1 DinB family protein [Chondrinema litorale]
MKQILTLLVLTTFLLSCSEKNSNPELKPLLIEQLKNTHLEQNWFVPTKIAIDELSAEQSNWKDSTENHSIAELVSHLIFWSGMNLRAFKGEDMTGVEVENEITFKKYTNKEWKGLTIKLDSIQTEWEKLTEKATDKQLIEWSTEILNMTAHNAYHTGQIIYIRKRNGWWNKK